MYKNIKAVGVITDNGNRRQQRPRASVSRPWFDMRR